MSDANTIHLPKDLARELASAAMEQDASPDEIAARAVQIHLDALKANAFFARIRKEADWALFDRLLSRKGGEPPREGDA